MRTRTRAVILVCRIASGFSNFNGLIVNSCNHNGIERESRCEEAIERLIDAGFELVSTVAIQNCGQIVYTFIRYNPSIENGTTVNFED